MGKLMNSLQKQLKDTDHTQDAKDCIDIYNWIKDSNKDGNVWNSVWTPLVRVTFVGTYPYIRLYSPTIIGHTLLKGIRSSAD